MSKPTMFLGDLGRRSGRCCRLEKNRPTLRTALAKRPRDSSLDVSTLVQWNLPGPVPTLRYITLFVLVLHETHSYKCHSLQPSTPFCECSTRRIAQTPFLLEQLNLLRTSKSSNTLRPWILQCLFLIHCLMPDRNDECC